jgi:hypothetical protein
VAKTLQTRKQTVDELIARLLDGSATEQELNAAVKNYKDAVEVVLNADTHSRALKERREMLTTFLTVAIPSSAVTQEHTAYVEFARELDAVNSAIMAMVAPSEESPGPQPLATEVTSLIAENTRLDRLASVTPDQLKIELDIASARVRVGQARAVFLTYPIEAAAVTKP